MVYTGCLGLAITDTLSDGLLAASPLDASAVDTNSLFVLVPQSASLVRACRSEKRTHTLIYVLSHATSLVSLNKLAGVLHVQLYTWAIVLH